MVLVSLHSATAVELTTVFSLLRLRVMVDSFDLEVSLLQISIFCFLFHAVALDSFRLMILSKLFAVKF